MLLLKGQDEQASWLFTFSFVKHLLILHRVVSSMYYETLIERPPASPRAAAVAFRGGDSPPQPSAAHRVVVLGHSD